MGRWPRLLLLLFISGASFAYAQQPVDIAPLLTHIGGSVGRIWVYEGPYDKAWKDLYLRVQSVRGGMLMATKQHVAMSHSSCVIIDAAAGTVVTNHHVVKGGLVPFSTFEVELPGSPNRIPLKLLGSDEDTDLAVLQVSDPKYLPLPAPELVWGDSDRAQPGQLVVAIGYPGQSYEIAHDTYFWNATTGIVSGRMRSEGVTQFVQTTAITDQGYSGGGLFTLDGRFLGIPTEAFGRGLSYAVASNLVHTIVDELIRAGTVRRAAIGTEWDEVRWLSPVSAFQLGLSIADWERFRDRALIVTTVQANGPAATAGVRPGDLVLSIDGHGAAWGEEMSRYITMQHHVGDTVTLTVYRPSTSKEWDIPVLLGDRHAVYAAPTVLH